MCTCGIYACVMTYMYHIQKWEMGRKAAVVVKQFYIFGLVDNFSKYFVLRFWISPKPSAACTGRFVWDARARFVMLQYIFYSGAVSEAANGGGCNSKRHSLISFSLKWPHARILHTWYSPTRLSVAVTAAGSLHFVVALSAFSTRLQQEL